MFLSHCPFSVPSSIISPASHAPCLVSFPWLQAFCSTNPSFCPQPYCQLSAASHGGTIHRPAHLRALIACTDTTVTDEEKRGAEAGGKAVLEHPPLPAAGERAQRRRSSPSVQITARMNLRSWEGKSRAAAFLAVFPPASSLSSFLAVGLFWPPKRVRCGLL